jgi:hypothetical protein
MANGISRNTSVSHIKVEITLDQTIFEVLATALLSNSTLRRLELLWQHSAYDYNLSPFFLASGKNTGLKSLSLNGFMSIDESLCTAMKDGLGMNTTLEYLKLDCARLTDENSDMWSRALSFVRTNKVLKSLVVNLKGNVIESRVAAFRTDIAVMLEDNASLESLSIRSWKSIKAEEFVALITALQHNTTLKSLLSQGHGSLHLTDDEDKRMAVLLKKNYALERLPDINHRGDVGAILRLNAAGRRYLVQDGSSISKGVEVLCAVSDEINCVFLHLLENPRLCDRSAVEETASTSSPEGSRGSTSQPNHNRKREQEQDQALREDKESRRRRT